MDDDSYEGYCAGYTVFDSTSKHPTLLGSDGEPLTLVRKTKIGFDLTPKNRNKETK